MSKPGRTILFGLSILLLLSPGISQERPQRPARPSVSDFNIEILNLDSPSYLASVPGTGARSGLWAHGDLHRIAGWVPSKEVPAEVSALQIQFWLDGVGVRLEVIAYLGRSGPYSKPPDWEKLVNVRVASSLLSEDEVISITETERFGIEPFSVKVSRARPWSIGAPEIINKTQALTVTGLTEERPAYTLTVRNVSHKHISAISWYGLANGRKSGGSGLSGARIIGAGGSFDIHQHFNFAEERPEESQTEQPPKRAIVIAAIVFEDGTFEGEADETAEMAARLAGSHIQFLRATQLLRDVSLVSGDDDATLLSKLKRDVALLDEDTDSAVMKELATRFAAASEDFRNRRMKVEVSRSLKLVKTDLLRQIEKFEYQRSHVPNEASLESWLRETIERLERSSGSY